MKTILLSLAFVLAFAAQAQTLVTTSPNHLKFYRVELAEPNADSAFVFKHLQYYGKQCLNVAPGSDAGLKTSCDSLRKYNDLYERYASDKANVSYTRAFTAYQKIHTEVMSGVLDNALTTSGEYFKTLPPDVKQKLQDNMKSATADFNAFLAAYAPMEDYRVTNARKWLREVNSYIDEVK